MSPAIDLVAEDDLQEGGIVQLLPAGQGDALGQGCRHSCGAIGVTEGYGTSVSSRSTAHENLRVSSLLPNRHEEAEAYYHRGISYAEKGEYDQAIADYEATLQINPDHAIAFHNRGLAYFDKGDYDRAIADFDEALRLNPDYESAYCNRGNAYYEKEGI